MEVTDEMEDAMQEHEEKGHTAVLIGINGKKSWKRKAASCHAISEKELRDMPGYYNVTSWRKTLCSEMCLR